MQENKPFKSGFVSIVGRPNVGKSTLMNTILGEKIAITSDKAQTTRNNIRGIYTTEQEQVVFLDTPGIHKPHHRLGEFMVKNALSSLNDVDLVLFMVNVTQRKGPGDQFIIERLKHIHTPVFLVLNKIDQIHPNELPEIVEGYKKEMDFKEIIPVSAMYGNNLQTLLSDITKYLQPGPQYYAADQVTDHPEYFIVGELVREKILHLTQEEIPHSVAIQMESIERDETTDKLHVRASIIVERESQKGIVIGKRGTMIKEIGTRARKDIENLLGEAIFLELFVKVKKNWRDRPMRLEELGYREEDY
ncbi:GTPase Era [Allofustis seminis]|uniref:GTPase Era n=1 Tax=Allofustis seminis TaxID=166939 RepID=UPI000365605B|nr:GTPase Era [Allofustis seminis]